MERRNSREKTEVRMFSCVSVSLCLSGSKEGRRVRNGEIEVVETLEAIES